MKKLFFDKYDLYDKVHITRHITTSLESLVKIACLFVIKYGKRTTLLKINQKGLKNYCLFKILLVKKYGKVSL